MSSSKVALVLLCFMLGACGFEPLHGRVAGGGSTQAELSLIEVSVIPDRSGQILRGFLLDRLTPRGAPREPRWRLDVDIEVSTVSLGVRKTAEATHANLWVRGNFFLKSVESGAVAVSGYLESVSSYDILASDFGSLRAEKDARERALRQLANDITSRVGVYFRGALSKRAKSGAS